MHLEEQRLDSLIVTVLPYSLRYKLLSQMFELVHAQQILETWYPMATLPRADKARPVKQQASNH